MGPEGFKEEIESEDDEKTMQGHGGPGEPEIVPTEPEPEIGDKKPHPAIIEGILNKIRKEEEGDKDEEKPPTIH